jgi:hypothetical protein
MKFVSLNPTTFKEFILSRVRGQSNMCDARANFSQQKTGVWTCTLRQPHSIDCKCAPYGQLPSSADVGKPPSRESQTRKKGVSKGLSVKSIMDYLANSGVMLKKKAAAISNWLKTEHKKDATVRQVRLQHCHSLWMRR